MTATIAQLDAIALEFSSVDSSIKQNFLDMALEFVNSSYFGAAKANIVQCLYAAHLMKSLSVGSSSSATGDILSETLGPVSKTYAAPQSAASDDLLGQTKYGKTIKLMIKTRALQKGVFVSY